MHDEPIDPFAGDPADPSNELADLDEVESEGGGDDPLTPAEREDVLEDLADLEIYQALLTPVGVRGLVIECEDCHEPHYFDWDLLRGKTTETLRINPRSTANPQSVERKLLATLYTGSMRLESPHSATM